MKYLNLYSLEARELSYKKKLEEAGKFTYLSGYKGYKYPVKVKHNKCGNIIEVMAESVVSPKKADECIHCSTSIRYKDLDGVQEEVDKKYKHLTIVDTALTKSKKRVFIVKCDICKHKYRVTYNQLKIRGFNCCEGNGSTYERHVECNARKIIREMKPASYLFGSALFDYVKEYIHDISYIKNKTVKEDAFAVDVFNRINKEYDDKRIAHCECCGELKKGIDWGTYRSSFERKVCYDCLQKKKICPVCEEEKRQKDFEFDYKNKSFNDKCIKCNID